MSERAAARERWRSLATVTALVVGVGWLTQGLQAWQAGRLGDEAAVHAAPGDIRMLASDTCEYCLRARAWFGRHGVPYTECSIERDADCAERFREARAPGTPVLLVRGAVLVGFDPRSVLAALQRPAGADAAPE